MAKIMKKIVDLSQPVIEVDDVKQNIYNTDYQYIGAVIKGKRYPILDLNATKMVLGSSVDKKGYLSSNILDMVTGADKNAEFHCFQTGTELYTWLSEDCPEYGHYELADQYNTKSKTSYDGEADDYDDDDKDYYDDDDYFYGYEEDEEDEEEDNLTAMCDTCDNASDCATKEILDHRL